MTPNAAGRRRRILLMAAGFLAGCWVVLTTGLYWAMRQPPDEFGQIMKHVPMPMMLVLPFETLWNSARGGTLSLGSEAPDFTLPLLDHSGTVQLSSFRGSRPVVLVFGSYT